VLAKITHPWYFLIIFIVSSKRTPKAIPAQIAIWIASIWVNLTAQKLLAGAIQIKNVLGLS